MGAAILLFRLGRGVLVTLAAAGLAGLLLGRI
jgi:hypothetical protein